MQNLSVKFGPELNTDILRQVYELDVEVYKDEGLQGEFDNLLRRYEFMNDSFICVMDGDTLAGYINFFPVSKRLRKDLFDEDRTELRDDDIMPEEMSHYSKEHPNCIFIISVVVSPEYRDGEAVKLIGNNFVQFIADKQKNGFHTSELCGAAVSDAGRRFLSRMGFEPRKKLDDGYELYVCDGDNLEELIEND